MEKLLVNESELILKAKNRTKNAWKISFSIAVGIPTIYILLILYKTWPISEFTMERSGQFGDSFGIVTSLLSGLAFAGLIWSIFLQREDLAYQRESLDITHQENARQTDELRNQKKQFEKQNIQIKIQSFENVFFKMLSFHNQIVNSLDLAEERKEGATKNGRVCFSDIYQDYLERHNSERDSYLIKTKKTKRESIRLGGGMLSTKEGVEVYLNPPAEDLYDDLSKDEIFNIIINSYDSFQSKYESYIGHYFSNLYNIIKLINLCDAEIKKKEYTNIVRAQLSKYELLILYYNCISRFGSAKFKSLVEEYQLLKHVDTESLAHKSHIQFYNESAFKKVSPV